MAKKNAPIRKKLLIANGVNLDLLGQREPEVYGSQSLTNLETTIKSYNEQLSKLYQLECELRFFQTNSEEKFLDELSRSHFDAAIINAGAWTHTSLALADRLAGLALPFVEVHISNIFNREPFRAHSYLAKGAIGSISGFGFTSYKLALAGLYEYLLTT